MNGTWWGLAALCVSMVWSQPLLAQEGGAGGAVPAGGTGGAATNDAGGGFGGTGGDDGGFGGHAGEPSWPVDNDGDGYADDVDCNDSRADVHPGADEYDVDCNDGEEAIDKDCDGYPAQCYYGSDDGGGVPLANLVGTVLVGVWLGGAAWRRRRS